MDRKKDKHSSNSRRGPNAKTKKDMVKEMPKNFFRKEHEKKGLNITFANAYDRNNGCIYIQYSLLGVEKSIGHLDQKQLGLMIKVSSMHKTWLEMERG
jgi:hypothetical protein